VIRAWLPTKAGMVSSSLRQSARRPESGIFLSLTGLPSSHHVSNSAWNDDPECIRASDPVEMFSIQHSESYVAFSRGISNSVLPEFGGATLWLPTWETVESQAPTTSGYQGTEWIESHAVASTQRMNRSADFPGTG
jgi:hypothetical protein